MFAATAAPNADDVMLVRADGSRTDFSQSAAPDAEPVLSPGGHDLGASDALSWR